MGGSDTTLAGLQHCARCCQLHDIVSCRVNSQSPPQVLAVGPNVYRSTSPALLRLRSGIVQGRKASAGDLCIDNQSTMPTCCSTGDDACAHPFSGWQVQWKRMRSRLPCFVRAPAGTDPCNVLQVGMHCRSQVR